MLSDAITIDPSANVKACPKTAVGANWPWPVEQRIRALVELANSVGANTTKQELIAAIVATCEATPARLDKALRNYRIATAGQISLRPPDSDGVIHIERRKQGRPSTA